MEGGPFSEPINISRFIILLPLTLKAWITILPASKISILLALGLPKPVRHSIVALDRPFTGTYSFRICWYLDEYIFPKFLSKCYSN